MATHIVTAPVIVVHASDGSQQYVYEGAEVPDFVKAATIKELKDCGLIATQRQAAAAAKADPKAPETPKSETGSKPAEPKASTSTSASAEDANNKDAKPADGKSGS